VEHKCPFVPHKPESFRNRVRKVIIKGGEIKEIEVWRKLSESAVK
jgi:hypothetical protein